MHIFVRILVQPPLVLSGDFGREKCRDPLLAASMIPKAISIVCWRKGSSTPNIRPGRRFAANTERVTSRTGAWWDFSAVLLTILPTSRALAGRNRNRIMLGFASASITAHIG